MSRRPLRQALAALLVAVALLPTFALAGSSAAASGEVSMSVGVAAGMRQALPPPDAVWRQIQQILSRPEFLPAEELPMSLHERVLRFLLGLIERAIRALDRLVARVEAAGGPARWVFIVLLTAAAAAILAHILYTAASALRPRQPLFAAPTAVASPEDPAALQRLARQAAAEGRWREAASLCYRAVLAQLAWQGAIEMSPGLTNWDYVDLMSDHQKAELFARLTRIADRAMYGPNPSAEAFSKLAELAEEFGVKVT